MDDNSDLPDYHAVYFSDSFPIDDITLTLPHMVPPPVLAADPAGNLQTADPQPAGAGNVDQHSVDAERGEVMGISPVCPSCKGCVVA